MKLKLPIGIQTFETIRTESYLYIDKTRFLVNLIDSGKIFFLARPRRFGKSLTISNFDALFSGKKELFDGLDTEEALQQIVEMNDAQPYPNAICVGIAIDDTKRQITELSVLS